MSINICNIYMYQGFLLVDLYQFLYPLEPVA